MDFEKVKQFASRAGEKGLQASKKWMNKAGAKAQDLGEKGVLVIEIKQLKGQAQKLIETLGLEVYEALVTQRVTCITCDTPKVKGILDEIALIQHSITEKETALQSRMG